MFVIELTYQAPLTAIDARMPAHMAFLRTQYKAGHFVMSGRQLPRVGGIILAVGESKEQIEGIIRQDPFVSDGLTFRIIEFRASQKADDIQRRIENAG